MADTEGLSRKATILVVDDARSNLSLVSGLLEDSYIVKVANSGEKALKIAMAASRPDLILLDIMMPEMDGYEVCRRLRANAKTRDIPVVFLTAKSEVADETLGFELGAVDYITKPISPPILLARIKTHLEIKNTRDFLRKTFGRYLSDEVVEKLLESPDGLKLGGEALVVTVLMSDLRGFSAITGNLPPETVVSMLNVYFNEMTGIIFNHSGTINDIIGNQLVVIFGAPHTRPEDPDLALACALEMQRTMGKVNAKNKELGFPELEMGIGITTGRVVVGNIGSDTRVKYTAIGNSVNLAGRIESFTVGGQVLVSEATLKATTLNVKTRNSFSVSFKGLSKPMEIREVLEVSGKFNVSLPETEIVYTPLAKEIPVSFEVYGGKVSGLRMQTGGISSLASKHAVLEHGNTGKRTSDLTLVQLHSNLRLVFPFNDAAGNAAEAYIKVIQKLGDCKFEVRFTSVTEEVNIILEMLRTGNMEIRGSA